MLRDHDVDQPENRRGKCHGRVRLEAGRVYLKPARSASAQMRAPPRTRGASQTKVRGVWCDPCASGTLMPMRRRFLLDAYPHGLRALVPLIFEPYAEDLARRLVALAPSSVLEVAAGSGVASRALSTALGPSVTVVRSDLSQPMFGHARTVGTTHPVEWRQADVMEISFASESFDAVVCQVGVVFFPDRAAAFAEVARVLRPGEVLLFNVWDCLTANEFADAVTRALAAPFPDDPPMFLDRTPHGYYSEPVINGDLAAAGFDVPANFGRVDARSSASRDSGDRILPGHAIAQRNRGSRSARAGRGHRRGRIRIRNSREVRRRASRRSDQRIRDLCYQTLSSDESERDLSALRLIAS